MNLINSIKEIEQNIIEFQEFYASCMHSISSHFIGHSDIVQCLWIAFMAGGHVLIEGLPGLGKTFLAQSLANALGLDWKRIQFTPDLMPSDILGSNILTHNENSHPIVSFEQGPVFTELLLADEINRATPRTQSALLEAMQEKQVTIFGKSHSLSPNFMVIATQNPIEMEGTYPLPEAQLDRFFFKLSMQYPSLEDLIKIGKSTTCGKPMILGKSSLREKILNFKKIILQVEIADYIIEEICQFILETQPNRTESLPLVKEYVKYGASPRGVQTLILGAKIGAFLQGRMHVSKEDYYSILIPSLQHRICLNFSGEAEGLSTIDILDKIKSKF
ncbi:MAG TPA: AAA family ATPase [Planctomycetota bacterium]|nr:AAA family ATPase [Planctomycetota bacterium]